jgi:hypothetical protein
MRARSLAMRCSRPFGGLDLLGFGLALRFDAGGFGFGGGAGPDRLRLGQGARVEAAAPRGR